jgi:uncharacterized surface protein with fasciclin (FAS1) repeats
MNLKAILCTTTLLATLTSVTSLNTAHADEHNSLLQTAIAVNSEGAFAGAFDTLIAAVIAADPQVLAVLSAKGQHTVFAPTDDAFSMLGLDEYNIGDLPTDTLTTILLYHVVHGRLDAEDVIASNRLNTLVKGKQGFLAQDGGQLTDNSARVAAIIVTDVEASNGIIHVIDNVVLP